MTSDLKYEEGIFLKNFFEFQKIRWYIQRLVE